MCVFNDWVQEKESPNMSRGAAKGGSPRTIVSALSTVLCI